MEPEGLLLYLQVPANPVRNSPSYFLTVSI